MSATWRSKLNTTYSRDVINGLDQAHQQELKKLRAKAGNKRCADCGGMDNTWAIVNFGVFVCVHCASIHRSIAHVSKVKGCTGTYLWGPDEMDRMREGGNIRAAAVLGVVGGGAEVPSGGGDQAWVKFVLAKYEEKRWAPTHPVLPEHTPSITTSTTSPPSTASTSTTSTPTTFTTTTAATFTTTTASMPAASGFVAPSGAHVAPAAAAAAPRMPVVACQTRCNDARPRPPPVSEADLDSFFDTMFSESPAVQPRCADRPLSHTPAAWERDLIDF